MSYPGYSNYNSYYGAARNDPTQNGYSASRSQAPPSSYPDPVAYGTEERQTQYSPQDFSWPSQNQHSYTNNQTAQGQYQGDPYRDSTNGQNYDYQQAHASHTGSNKRQAEMKAYTATASHSPKQPSTQALNELAYASGLESSSLPPASSSRPVQPPQKSYTPSNAALTQPRSEVSKAQQSYGSQSQRSPYVMQPSSQTPNQKHLALQAAAALQDLPKISRLKAASPVLSHAPLASTPTPSKQRSQPPYAIAQASNSYQRDQSSQSAKNQQSAGAGRMSPTDPMIKSPSVSPQQSYSVTPNDARLATIPMVNNSIASLVTSHDQQGSPAYPSPTEESTSTTFINPREVFNPYHREHERARREAAAAEAAAKRAGADDALKVKYAPSTKPPVENRLENANSGTPTKVANPKPNTAAKAKASGSAPVDESESATELRQLLARMKELRGKDAALFQKVWDEEKGAPAAKASKALPMPSQQALPHPSQAITQATKSAPRPPTASRQLTVGNMPRGFNGHKVVIEDNVEGLPDLAKFPAARRVKYSYASRAEQEPPTSTQRQNLPPMPRSARAAASDPMPHPGPLVFDPNVASDSVSVVQALPAREKDGTTIWPLAKRTLLAKQAVIFLKSEPRNEPLTISESEIVAMLESNPSYITLCQLIEVRGFRFDRAYLAKHLITTVPDLSTSQQDTQSPTPNPVRVQAGSNRPLVAHATFNPPAANHAPTLMNGAFIKPETPFQPIRAATPLIHQRNIPLSTHGRARLNVPTSLIPTPIPGSKEDMSRKRGFEDLVDLTNDDDDYVVPEKKPRLQSNSPDPIAAFAEDLQPPSRHESSFVRFGSPNPQGMLPAAVAPLRFNTHILASSRPEPKQAWPPKAILARKLNKAEALRRNYYDPKTVARDILISTGRHPTERPLNGHLAGLLGNHIEMESDLSTFHWEDIDPGGPPPPKTAWSDIPAGPPRFKSRLPGSNRFDLLAKTDPTNPRYKAPQKMSSEQARGRVTGGPTRGESLRAPTTASEYAGRFGSGDFRRVKDQPPPLTDQMPRSLAGSTRRNSSPGAARRAEAGLRNLAQLTKSLFDDSFKPAERRPSDLHQSQAAASEAESPSVHITPKRRGSPPRKPNLPESSPQPAIEPPPRRGPGRPPRSTASPHVQISSLRLAGSVRSSQRSVSAEKLTMEGNFWPSGKPKGRPPGAKNKILPSEKKTNSMSVQVVVPPLPAEATERPEYPVFKCRWFKCGAELHNLATLRKHVAKLHKPAQDIIDEIGYGCYWKKCSLLRQDENGDFEPTPIATEEDWMEHINDEHISRVGQKHGDGPSTRHIGKQNEPFEAIVSKYLYNPSLFPTDARIVSYTDPQAVASERTAYLADESGRVTTHLADNNDEPDVVILTDFYTKDAEANKAAEMAFNSFLKTQGHPKQDMRAAAEATFKAMAARKEKIGVGIDRGGCTLVNDERRKTFVQNPGISKAVDYDY